MKHQILEFIEKQDDCGLDEVLDTMENIYPELTEKIRQAVWDYWEEEYFNRQIIKAENEKKTKQII